MRFETAADAERVGLELFCHNWCSPEGALELRRFLVERYQDEMDEALAKRRAGDRSDVWGEVRRLAEWIGAVDDDRAMWFRAFVRRGIG